MQPMKYRDITIFSGHRFQVPQGLQRIDHGSTHGWQLRYGGTQLFSDFTSDGSGAAASLAAAIKELVRRIQRLPAPSRLQHEPNANKTSDLPVGISGPIVRLRPGARVHECSFAVSVPRFGTTPRRRSVYIANENTWSQERYEAALARAIEIRREAEVEYQRDATRAKRAAGRALKAAQAASR